MLNINNLYWLEFFYQKPKKQFKYLIMEYCSILWWMFWNLSETMRYESSMLPINKMYFLFTVYMLLYLTFFYVTLMFVYLQKLLNCLIIYLYKTNDEIHRFHLVHEICNQSDLAIHLIKKNNKYQFLHWTLVLCESHFRVEWS